MELKHELNALAETLRQGGQLKATRRFVADRLEQIADESSKISANTPVRIKGGPFDGIEGIALRPMSKMDGADYTGYMVRFDHHPKPLPARTYVMGLPIGQLQVIR